MIHPEELTMPKPTNTEFFTDNTHTTPFEEHSEVPLFKKNSITVRISSADVNGNRKTGTILRHFSKVDGIPLVTILNVPIEDVGGQQLFDKQADVRPVRGTQSLQVITWDRKTPPAGAGEVQSRRRRFTGK
jgi:hypothetical protein